MKRYRNVKLDTGEDEFDLEEEDDLMLDETDMSEAYVGDVQEEKTAEAVDELDAVTADLDSTEE